MTGNLIAVLRALAFVVIALALCGVVFEFVGYDSVLMFRSIIDGAFGSARAVLGSLRWALPLFLTAAGVVISFRCGYFNIGAQGQFYAGAMAAAFVPEYLAGAPPGVVIPLTMLAGMLGGALWAFWPGWLRLRQGTDEVITTLMGNFIAHLMLIYVTSGPLKDPSGTGQVSASRAFRRAASAAARAFAPNSRTQAAPVSAPKWPTISAASTTVGRSTGTESSSRSCSRDMVSVATPICSPWKLSGRPGPPIISA